MLQLNIYSTIVPSTRLAKTGSRFSSIIRHKRNQILRGRSAIKALKDELDGGKSGPPGDSWDPGLEFEVPFEQRPVNEYSSLKEAALYSWANMDPGSFFLRLGGLWLGTFTVLGVPIAAASFNLSKVVPVEVMSDNDLAAAAAEAADGRPVYKSESERHSSC